MLFLQQTRCNDEGIVILAFSLHYLSSLELLDVSENEISAAAMQRGVPSFLTALSTLSRLRKVFIHRNAVPEIQLRFSRLIVGPDSSNDQEVMELVDNLWGLSCDQPSLRFFRVLWAVALCCLTGIPFVKCYFSLLRRCCNVRTVSSLFH